MSYAIVVDWYGPYASVNAAKEAIRQWGMGEMLYMAIGTVGQEGTPQLQYVGITKNFANRMQTRHKVRSKINEEGLSIYIGEVSSQAVSGRKASHHHKGFTVPVYLAESALAFFLQLPLNSDKRCSRPTDSIVLLNRWWKVDGETRCRYRPHAGWPDFIEYDDYSDTGSVVWHGGQRKQFSSAHIDEICGIASKKLRAARQVIAA